MGRLLALFLLAIIMVIAEIESLFWVLAIIEIASLYWDYRETTSGAHYHPSGAPPPMLDEPQGAPTCVAPSENETNRVYGFDTSTPSGWRLRGGPIIR